MAEPPMAAAPAEWDGYMPEPAPSIPSAAVIVGKQRELPPSAMDATGPRGERRKVRCLRGVSGASDCFSRFDNPAPQPALPSSPRVVSYTPEAPEAAPSPEPAAVGAGADGMPSAADGGAARDADGPAPRIEARPCPIRPLPCRPSATPPVPPRPPPAPVSALSPLPLFRSGCPRRRPPMRWRVMMPHQPPRCSLGPIWRCLKASGKSTGRKGACGSGAHARQAAAAAAVALALTLTRPRARQSPTARRRRLRLSVSDLTPLRWSKTRLPLRCRAVSRCQKRTRRTRSPPRRASRPSLSRITSSRAPRRQGALPCSTSCAKSHDAPPTTDV